MTSRRMILIAALLVVPGRAGAQSCNPSLTVRECYTELRRGTIEEQASKIEAKPTGDQQATETATSIYDFLPKLAGAAVLPGLADDFMGVSLKRNFSLASEYLGYLPLAIQLGGALRKPVLFPGMLDAVPEARRPIVKERLEDDLDEFDDPELSFGLAVESKRFGRRMEHHRDELSNVTPPELTKAFSDDITRLQILVAAPTPNCTQTDSFAKPLDCFSPADQAGIINAITTVVAADTAFSRALLNWQKLSGWDLLPDLINNKPQITFRAAWNPVDDAIGPQTLELSAKFEVGLANINATRRFCQRNNGYPNNRFTTDCFRQHVMNSLNGALLKMGLRFFLQLDAQFDREFSAPFLVEDGASFSTPSAMNYELSGGLGANLPGAGDVESARFDLGFGHVRAAQDGARTDARTWINLSYTQKLSGKVAMISGLEWSDKGVFKFEPTRKLRGNLGVSYKMISNDDPAK